jgi:ABC-2 type transport system permease protein
MVLIVAGSALFFDVHAPSQFPGFILAAVLAAACLSAIGLVIAGLWQPSRTVRPLVMHDISHLTPLGAAVHAMLRSLQGSFPTIGSLAVMAAWAAVFGIAAVRLFRRE